MFGVVAIDVIEDGIRGGREGLASESVHVYRCCRIVTSAVVVHEGLHQCYMANMDKLWVRIISKLYAEILGCIIVKEQLLAKKLKISILIDSAAGDGYDTLSNTYISRLGRVIILFAKVTVKIQRAAADGNLAA